MLLWKSVTNFSLEMFHFSGNITWTALTFCCYESCFQQVRDILCQKSTKLSLKNDLILRHFCGKNYNFYDNIPHYGLKPRIRGCEAMLIYSIKERKISVSQSITIKYWRSKKVNLKIAQTGIHSETLIGCS